jgi:hypothetical protein
MSGATTALRGGRTWWAHFEFTRINIAPIILRKKIEEPLILDAFLCSGPCASL